MHNPSAEGLPTNTEPAEGLRAASDTSAGSTTDPMVLAADLYRVTINRLAIEIRTAGNPDYADDTGLQLTHGAWHDAAASIAKFIEGDLDLRNRQDVDLATHLAMIVDPYNRPDMADGQRIRWRDLDSALENAGAVIEWDEPPQTLLPLLEFYAGLVRIDRTVARFYDSSRYDKFMNWALGIGAILLVMTIGTAAAQGFKGFDWSKVPKEGSLGVLCGFVLGFLLDMRRRYKTRKLVEEWGEKFGCDLRDLRWRRLPRFVDRVRREIRRLGGEDYAKLEADELETAVKKLMAYRGYQGIGP
ncbi:MAG: hypothetical protein AAF556_08510 [Pseudomonadota bacterium]